MSKEGGSDQPNSIPSESTITMAELKAAVPAVEGLSAAEREAIQTTLKATLESYNNKPSPYIESLSPKIRTRVEALQELQKEHDELEAKFYEEKAALEAKYQKLYDPLYTKRSDIVNGVTEPAAVKPSEDDLGSEATPADDGVKGVPDFWLMALKANEVTQEQITERDEGALKFLKDIKWSGFPDAKGFKLDFYFAENPYFKNSLLTKTYYMIDDEEPILEKAEGTEIQWNAGKNLTQKILKKKPKKGAKNTKPVTKTEDCESFFNFFNPPQVPADEEEIEEEEAELLQEQMEADYEIGSILKEKVIPHAVSWFTGEAVDDELDYDDEDEEEGDDDDDDDELDEEDEDDEDDEEEKPSKQTKSKGQKKGGGAKKEGEQPQECKQQ